MNRGLYIKQTILAAAAFIAAYMLSLTEAYIASGTVLAAAGIVIAVIYIKKSSKLSEPAAYFSISWIGGCGISAMKLSRLQSDWAIETWLCFFLAYAFFIFGYALFSLRKCLDNDESSLSAAESDKVDIVNRKLYADGLMTAINIVILLSVSSLIAESVILGYIPLFTKDTPHAYSYFHVSGLHYFTVSCVLVPSLAVLWYKQQGGIKNKSDRLRAFDIAVCCVISIIIPLLLVSRFQLIFAVLLSGMTYICVNSGQLPFKIGLREVLIGSGLFGVLVVLYVFITIERAHSIEYLNEIFEMKYRLPIFLSQPYIYIANNFDNFNCLTEALTEHAGGLRMLFPLFALTGLKFTHPEFVAFPIFVTKEELTTVTLIYDAYYDFGIIGVMIFMFVLGAAMACLGACIRKNVNTSMIPAFIYAQLDFYLLFAFFTTWFSNPATWFYLIASAAIGIFICLYVKFAEHIYRHNNEGGSK